MEIKLWRWESCCCRKERFCPGEKLFEGQVINLEDGTTAYIHQVTVQKAVTSPEARPMCCVCANCRAQAKLVSPGTSWTGHFSQLGAAAADRGFPLKSQHIAFLSEMEEDEEEAALPVQVSSQDGTEQHLEEQQRLEEAIGVAAASQQQPLGLGTAMAEGGC
ncbi:zinc finger protein 76 isoform X2 [Colius striatus]|uniref:zinc finger protein 76 isoform X2 n=1 Tax=Colius striatus TaxID=57412 RepID=UPI002B1E6BA2|nr:zinc finger protein 76 isoform X2 [Colius striatus]